MLYVKRDAEGHIIAINSQAALGCSEAIAEDDQEIARILASQDDIDEGDHTSQLVESDLDFIRVVEDLINLLIEKNLICFTDLPAVAQQKINRRRSMRAALNREMDLLDDEDFLI